MLKVNIFQTIINLKRKFLENLKPKDIKNHDGKSFTRKRSLTLGRILTILLRCSPSSLQIRLDDYFREIGCEEEVVSKQALSKARTNLPPEIVKESFLLTTKTMLECKDLDYFKGKYRLAAMDGSGVALDNNPELLEEFGGSGSNGDCAMAMASFCYDPLNNIILDGALYPYAYSEREAARKHIDEVSRLPIPDGVFNLYIGDRGYPSRELLAYLIDKNSYFFMRVRRKYDLSFDNVETEEIITFIQNGKTYRVRVIAITLDSGEKEILVTNLGECDLKREEAGELYFKRWGIEVKFDSLKNKLELENMSGRRVVTTYQDFWAKLDIANTIAALEFSTDHLIAEKSANRDNKHVQTTNENRMITKFADQYIRILSCPDPVLRDSLFKPMLDPQGSYSTAQSTRQISPSKQLSGHTFYRWGSGENRQYCR